MADYINLILRSILAITLLLFLARFMGRKMIAQMTFFDFAVGVTIGSVAGTVAINGSTPLTEGVIVLITLALLAVLFDIAHIKSLLINKVIDSEPAVVLENGKINYPNMKRLRLSIVELLMLLREKNIFNIGDVEFAILEPDGKLSVLLKSQRQYLTPADLNIPTPYKGLTLDAVLDGRIMEENLGKANLTREWLLHELEKRQIKDLKEVFYVGLDTEGNLYISLKNKTKETELDGSHMIE